MFLMKLTYLAFLLNKLKCIFLNIFSALWHFDKNPTGIVFPK
jgi:hypothetical protein